MTLTKTEAISRYEAFLAEPEKHISNMAEAEKLPCEMLNYDMKKVLFIKYNPCYYAIRQTLKSLISLANMMTVNGVMNPVIKDALIKAITEHIELLKQMEE
jgi:hypothetical protein